MAVTMPGAGVDQDMHHRDSVPPWAGAGRGSRLERETASWADRTACRPARWVEWIELDNASGNRLAVGEDDRPGDGFETFGSSASRRRKSEAATGEKGCAAKAWHRPDHTMKPTDRRK
jgi:hypothetical protein